MSKLAVQGLLAITATLWLAQPLETTTALAGSRGQFNTEQINDSDMVVESPTTASLDKEDRRRG